MNRVQTALIAGAVALVTGCGGHVETHAVMLRAPVPPTAGRVEVYMVGQQPARRFYEMGFVQAVGFADTANAEDLVKGLVTRGAEVGCEAIVRVQVDLGYTRAHASGVCVRYLEGPAAGAAPYVPPSVTDGPRPNAPNYRPTPAPRNETSPSNLNPGTGI
jgi:hypothetical protein